MIFNDCHQLNQALPKVGRVMAIDVGTKRIGIALSDETRFLATPKLVLQRLSNLKDFAKIQQFAQENNVCAIIIGYPRKLDGSKDEMTDFVERFAKNLDEFLLKKFPILLFDERLSSAEAREINASELSRKNNTFVDDIAASVILQHFLDEIRVC